MKRGRFTEEQIIAVLRGHEAGRRLPTWLASIASRKGRFATGKPGTAACWSAEEIGRCDGTLNNLLGLFSTSDDPRAGILAGLARVGRSNGGAGSPTTFAPYRPRMPRADPPEAVVLPAEKALADSPRAMRGNPAEYCTGEPCRSPGCASTRSGTLATRSGPSLLSLNGSASRSARSRRS
jgi:hypothetical protein